MAEDSKALASALLGLHAQTSLHPGSGTALGTVDLPVQRERHTQWPVIPGSALKGILRDVCREKVKGAFADDGEQTPAASRRTARDKANAEHAELVAAFGPDTANADAHAGAIGVTDARLLAFPVRSLKGVFAWITCPAVVDRLLRDVTLATSSLDGLTNTLLNDNTAVVPKDGCPCLVDGSQLVLEEFDFQKGEGDTGPLAKWVVEHLLPTTAVYQGTCTRFLRQLVILPDDYFTHFVRHATEVTARIGLNYETKTVRQGALFYQEFLPPETVFYSVVLANPGRSRNGNKYSGRDLLKFVWGCLPAILQVGGDETIGKGLCAARLTCEQESFNGQ